jgi:hypothetical protein
MGFNNKTSAREKLSKDVLNKLQRNLEGLELFVLDEVSLVSLSEFATINSRLQQLASVSIDPTRRERSKLPFGGYHIIIAGDFCQLPTFTGKPIWSTQLIEQTDKDMQQLWRIQITHYNRLTRNFRADGDPIYAKIMKNARSGNVTQLDLAHANTRCMTHDEAREAAHESAIWLTSTHAQVNRFNDEAFAALASKGAHTTRILAHHRAKTSGSPGPTPHELNKCFGVPGGFTSRDNQPPAALDLAEGTRVKLTDNSCVSLGLFNGAMGTIK